MRRLDRLARSAIRTRFLVSTTAGETFDAVLIEVDPTTFVFDDVAAIAQNGDRSAVAGRLWIPRVTVKYLQQT